MDEFVCADAAVVGVVVFSVIAVASCVGFGAIAGFPFGSEGLAAIISGLGPLVTGVFVEIIASFGEGERRGKRNTVFGFDEWGGG